MFQKHVQRKCLDFWFVSTSPTSLAQKSASNDMKIQYKPSVDLTGTGLILFMFFTIDTREMQHNSLSVKLGLMELAPGQ